MARGKCFHGIDGVVMIFSRENLILNKYFYQAHTDTLTIVVNSLLSESLKSYPSSLSWESE